MSHTAVPPQSPTTSANADTTQALWMPLLALWLLSLAAAAALAPLVGAAADDQGTALATTLTKGIWVLAAVSPILALLKGAVLAGAAWSVLTLMGSDVSFRGTFVSVLVGEVILAVQGLWVAGVLRLQGQDGISGPGGLDVTTGLNLFFPDPTTAMGALAVTVTPFHVAWVLFLWWRFAGLAQGSRVRGGTAALVCWLMVTSVGMLGGALNG